MPRMPTIRSSLWLLVVIRLTAAARDYYLERWLELIMFADLSFAVVGLSGWRLCGGRTVRRSNDEGKGCHSALRPSTAPPSFRRGGVCKSTAPYHDVRSNGRWR